MGGFPQRGYWVCGRARPDRAQLTKSEAVAYNKLPNGNCLVKPTQVVMSGSYEDRNQVLGVSIGGALLVGALWAIATNAPANQSEIATDTEATEVAVETAETPTSEPSSLPSPEETNSSTEEETPKILVAVGDRLSWGNKLLFPEAVTPEKLAAAEAIAAGDYEKAETQLEQSLRNNPNDPEALIYLNNARIGEGKSYAIAVAVPIGENATAAQEILRGAAQAQDAINTTGGIDGIPLKILIANDDNDPDIAAQLAQVFADTPEVLSVIGHFSSDATQAAAQVYQARELVAISPTSSAVELTEGNDYLFRTVPSDRLASSALANYMSKTLNKQKVALFYNSTDSYSLSLAQTFAEEVEGTGGEVVVQFDLNSTDFEPEAAMEEAIAREAEVLMFAPDSALLETALAVVEANQNNLPMLAGDSAYTGKSLAIAGDKTVDMVVAVPWHILSDPDGEFSTAATQLWKGDVNWRTAMAYDAMQAPIAAMESEATRTKIQQTLSASGFQATGASGSVSFLPSGDRQQSVQLVKIQPGTRTKFGYEFVPIP